MGKAGVSVERFISCLRNGPGFQAGFPLHTNLHGLRAAMDCPRV